MSITEQVGFHHWKEFGAVPLERIGMKLGEEAGELQGALVRLCEERDGEDWLPEVESELKDVLVVLIRIAYGFGWDVHELVQAAGVRFCERTWPGVKPVKSLSETDPQTNKPDWEG